MALNPTSLNAALERATTFLSKNPGARQRTYTAHGELGSAYEVHVRTDGHDLRVDQPSSIGGGDSAPGPVQMALAALGSCQAITYRIWSEHLGIVFDHLTVLVEADFDPSGFLGVPGAGAVGPTAVRVLVTIDGPEPGRYEELRAAVNAHCPVLDIFAGTVPVAPLLQRTRAVSAA